MAYICLRHQSMKAWTIDRICDLSTEEEPLTLRELDPPAPQGNDVLLRVIGCGVCHTELDEIEGRTPPPEFPVIPGHQVVGTVIDKGPDCKLLAIGC
jgi:propanol-preferring alcohol dehydrogenase